MLLVIYGKIFQYVLLLIENLIMELIEEQNAIRIEQLIAKISHLTDGLEMMLKGLNEAKEHLNKF